MNGYIKIDRSILYHPALQKRGQEFCEKGAFMWLLLEASFIDRVYRIKDKTIFLKRGQLCCSLTYMAEAWGWDKSKVQRFLDKLKKFSTISTDTPNDTPADTPDILTICHYDKYQDTPTDTPTDNKHNKGYNKGNNTIDEKAFEEWWKSFNYVGKNKGSTVKAKTFFKNTKDPELLKKVKDTYNDFSAFQQSKSLGVPMVATWINQKRWENYTMSEPESEFIPMKKDDAYLRWVPWVKKGMRSTAISQDMVHRMKAENLITEEEFKAW